ncbi:MAG TPA: M61 family peptidase [Terriglobales bacterium]|nr:M61 family peptidase [Terriglobales bacterium]
MRRLLILVSLFASCLGFFSPNTYAQAIHLTVDLTDAPRNIYHAQLTLPVKPGPLTLVYPKWVPGNHRPSGPIENVTGVKMEAAGRSLPWERDSVDMYAFHVDVPSGVSELQVSLDTITTSGVSGASGAAASSHVLDLNWNQVLLYPQNTNSDDVQFMASVRLPVGWKFGTALKPEEAPSQSSSEIHFKPVSLTTLVDSPLIAGDHFRKIQLTKPGETPVHEIDMVSESDAGLAMTSEDEAAYRKLVAETGALFGARHYLEYHFLFTLSDEVGGRGLEHHQSSDNGIEERGLIDPDIRLLDASLLPHEFTHSWNGKYRRPAGLATRNYQEPMIGDLLWVYEGLTEYLGNVLTARSGLWSPEEYRETLAATAAMLDHRAGRTWRPLEDTARSVQILRLAGPVWQNWRRGLDYYPEGELIWLDVDMLIHQQTHGQKSLNDFCHLFHGGQSGPPKVVPYTFDDLVNTLNQVTPYDWARLLRERTNAVTTHAPLGGIERGGWKLVYDDHPNLVIHASEKLGKSLNAFYSLGFSVRENGELQDVIPGSPAYTAGIGPEMKLVAINGRRWSKDVLRDTLRTAKQDHQPIDLLIENAQFFKTYSIPYYDGEKYPHLERTDGPDVLGDILKAASK